MTDPERAPSDAKWYFSALARQQLAAGVPEIIADPYITALGAGFVSANRAQRVAPVVNWRSWSSRRRP